MLVISRSEGQVFTIGKDVKIRIIQTRRGSVRIGIEAPKDVSIKRDDMISPEAKNLITSLNGEKAWLQ